MLHKVTYSQKSCLGIMVILSGPFKCHQVVSPKKRTGVERVGIGGKREEAFSGSGLVECELDWVLEGGKVGVQMPKGGKLL